MIRHRACSLKDTAYAIMKSELDEEFEKLCEETQESRRNRGTILFFNQFKIEIQHSLQ